jgi:DNA polymerase-3 subunit delta'
MIIGHTDTIADFKDLISRDALGHGYVFFGPAMTGKKMLALGLANFFEVGTFEPPLEHAVLQDTKLIDFAFMQSINPDATNSIGIDAVREIKEFLWQRPAVSVRRTLIIDNAELLTTEAQNALLKITEEPPVSSLLILVTSDIESIMPTILSRLPKMYFGTVATATIATWLVERHGLTKAKAEALAQKSFGKPGLAVRLLDDKDFQENLALAEQFLKTPSASRRDFIKKLIEPDDFRLKNFLDAVVMTLAWEKPSKAKAQFWHRALRLYDSANNFGLNPRLQLEALMK